MRLRWYATTSCITDTIPKRSGTPSASRSSRVSSMKVSVSILGCVYQSPSAGRTIARRWSSSRSSTS